MWQGSIGGEWGVRLRELSARWTELSKMRDDEKLDEHDAGLSSS